MKCGFPHFNVPVIHEQESIIRRNNNNTDNHHSRPRAHKSSSC